MKLIQSLFFVVIVFIFSCSTALAMNISMNTIDIPKYFYSIEYPAGWKHKDFGKGLVVFSGKTLDRKSKILINIQTIATKKNGGHYADVKALMDDFRQQVSRNSDKAVFLDRSDFTMKNTAGKTLKGEQTTLTFNEKGKKFKHWQIMLLSEDGMLFQNWAYRTLETEFDDNRLIAEAMLMSWKIKSIV